MCIDKVGVLCSNVALACRRRKRERPTRGLKGCEKHVIRKGRDPPSRITQGASSAHVMTIPTQHNSTVHHTEGCCPCPPPAAPPQANDNECVRGRCRCTGCGAVRGYVRKYVLEPRTHSLEAAAGVGLSVFSLFSSCLHHCDYAPRLAMPKSVYHRVHYSSLLNWCKRLTKIVHSSWRLQYSTVQYSFRFAHVLDAE